MSCGQSFLIFLCLLGSSLAPAASYGQPTEYQVKAAFLCNFIKFTNWPDSVLAEGDSLVIGVIGRGPMNEALAQIAPEKAGNSRAVVLRNVSGPEAATRCHVLFVSTSGRGQFQQLAAELKGRPVLTIGDTPGFLQSGGIINLFLFQSRVKFEVNEEASQAAGLVLRSQLLRLAANSSDKSES